MRENWANYKAHAPKSSKAAEKLPVIEKVADCAVTIEKLAVEFTKTVYA